MSTPPALPLPKMPPPPLLRGSSDSAPPSRPTSSQHFPAQSQHHPSFPPPHVVPPMYAPPALQVVRKEDRGPTEVGEPCPCVYVNHLNQKYPPEVLKQMLHDSFSKFGNIANVHVRRAYKTRGQAWVTYDPLTAAQKAVQSIRSMDRFEVGDRDPNFDRPVQVNFAKTNKSPASTVEAKRKRADESVDTDDADKPSVKRGKVQREFVPPHSTLLITGLAEDVTEATLESMFGTRSGFKKVRFIKNRHVAFVDFNAVSDAVQALHFIDSEGIALNINFAKQ